MDTDVRRPIILATAFGGVAALFVYSRTRKGESDIADAVDSIGETMDKVVSGVRGIRNNNPGNIRKSAEQWQGLAEDQTDPAFFRFVSMPYGIRAMARILRKYQASYGLDTVQGIISRWAPPNENDTGAYQRSVATNIGTTTTARLSLDDPDTLFALVRAIISHENGAVAALLVSDDAVRQGIALA